jgi:hypothetical protein
VAVMSTLLHHFSENMNIREFVPHVPRTNPSQAPAVWAIDPEHAPLYWFPRECPRVTIWPRTPLEQHDFRGTFHTSAPRLHAIEWDWLDRMRAARIYRYDFDPRGFEPWANVHGQWISHDTVVPVNVTAMSDLLNAHAAAAIELRAVPTLWPLHDVAVSDRWAFSIVRMTNAQPRRPEPEG